METITELAKKVESFISDIVLLNGSASRYTTFITKTGRIWKIRVSDHKANPDRTDNDTISFVVNLPEINTHDDDDDTYSALSVNKKSFKNIANQFIIENGVEVEFGDSVLDILISVIAI